MVSALVRCDKISYYYIMSWKAQGKQFEYKLLKVVNVDYTRGGNAETGTYGFKLAAWILGIATVGLGIFL